MIRQELSDYCILKPRRGWMWGLDSADYSPTVGEGLSDVVSTAPPLVLACSVFGKGDINKEKSTISNLKTAFSCWKILEKTMILWTTPKFALSGARNIIGVTPRAQNVGSSFVNKTQFFRSIWVMLFPFYSSSAESWTYVKMFGLSRLCWIRRSKTDEFL